MDVNALDGSHSLKNLVRLIQYNIQFRCDHPNYFYPDGLLIFCGSQGSGKTLSAVQYVQKLSWAYPKAILCTNVDINGLNPATTVIEYDGIDCLKTLENGEYGVMYLIDEIHLEFNSLESKNIDIDIMIEVSQQRKQRKHIIGTTQVYGRLAKPFREQLRDVVLCRKILGCVQWNTLINAENTKEEDGKLVVDKSKHIWWLHSPTLYQSYDTYAKMRRYRNEWQGRKRIDVR